jgi:hypothetical protein
MKARPFGKIRGISPNGRVFHHYSRVVTAFTSV